MNRRIDVGMKAPRERAPNDASFGILRQTRERATSWLDSCTEAVPRTCTRPFVDWDVGTQ